MESWIMYFDGTMRRSGAGTDIVLVSSEKYMLPYSFALVELCSNNVAEYHALIIGLQMALEIGEANVTTSHLIDKEYWRQPIIEYLEHGKLPNDSRHKTEEAHAGVCGAHQSGSKLQFQLRKIGYYWPKMVQDSIDYAKKCEACLYHANFIHQSP
ncbi:uncharacterized protein E5676_scaffold105G001190 [Cucumis melo var. makuwa]|uniref:Integrase zinc-binding domain-containing protein n=1 Tax=Cucumis melo var. makuwa TaxID=1194695 RepID=A0A5A7U3W3_CUCMM|nr:uncharacterized protein E6C27_scaffold13G001370 [Cucumis melo var. makuwa]TYK07701.1 uncharacterized protein E5676_scaffold105G001190 [Cucumis melo var. makuwa]